MIVLQGNLNRLETGPGSLGTPNLRAQNQRLTQSLAAMWERILSAVTDVEKFTSRSIC